MDYLSYGKKILYVLAAMLIGLMLSMELLDRHTPKEEAKQNVFSSVLPTWMKVGDLEPIDSDSQVPRPRMTFEPAADYSGSTEMVVEQRPGQSELDFVYRLAALWFGRQVAPVGQTRFIDSGCNSADQR
jgi:nucleoid-associated protein YgaU